MVNLITRKYSFVLDISEFFPCTFRTFTNIFYEIELQGFSKKVYERYSSSMLEQSLKQLCILHMVSSLYVFKNMFKYLFHLYFSGIQLVFTQ